MVALSHDLYPQLEITFGGKHAKRAPEKIDVEEFIGAKSFRAKGKRLTNFEVSSIRFIEPLIKEIPEEEIPEEEIPEEEMSEEELETDDLDSTQPSLPSDDTKSYPTLF